MNPNAFLAFSVVSLSLEFSSYTVAENGEYLEVCALVVMRPTLNKEVTLSFEVETISGTAESKHEGLIFVMSQDIFSDSFIGFSAAFM